MGKLKDKGLKTLKEYSFSSSALKINVNIEGA